MSSLHIRRFLLVTCFLLLFFIYFFSIYQLYPSLITHNALADHVFFFLTFITVFISFPYTTNLLYRQYSPHFFRLFLLLFFIVYYTLMRYNPLLNNYPYYIRTLFSPINTQSPSYTSANDWLFIGNQLTQLTQLSATSVAIEISAFRPAYFVVSETPTINYLTFIYRYWPQPFSLTKTPDRFVLHTRYQYILTNNYLQIFSFDTFRVQATSFGLTISYPDQNDISSFDISYSHDSTSLYDIIFTHNSTITQLFLNDSLVYSQKISLRTQSPKVGDDKPDGEHGGNIVFVALSFLKYYILNK